MRSLKSILLSFLFAISSGAIAQEVIPDFYKGPGLEPQRAYVNQSFNEHIDPFNGSLQLHYVDIHLPGTGGFNLDVQRSYNSAPVSETSPNTYFGSAGVGWTIHFGRVTYKVNAGPCGGLNFANVLSDPVLELPDGSTQILTASGTSPVLVTTQRWRADCTGTGYTVYSPNGTVYEMKQLVGGIANGISAYYTTKIIDRNGNFANLTYANGSTAQLQSVVAQSVLGGDQRRIDFTYWALGTGELTPRIKTIVAADSTGDHVYQYDYTAVNGQAGAYNLVKVTRPDNTTWTYTYYPNRNATIPGGFLLNTVTYPDLGTITYGYGTSAADYVYFDLVHSQARSPVVKTKTTSDNGSWSFAYAPWTPGASSDGLDVTTVTTPSGPLIYKHLSPNFAGAGLRWKVGLLMFKQTGAGSGIVQTETLEWTPQVISQQDFTRPGAWQAAADPTTNAPMLSSRVIVRDGQTYSTAYGNPDSNGNPRTITEVGPNGGSRTTTLTYSATNPNILSLVKDESFVGPSGASARQVIRSFDSFGNLLDITVDGVKTSHLYYPGGDLQQTTFPGNVTYPGGLVHQYFDYYRGIARTETQPEGVTLKRTVDDAGNLLSFTDGENNKTSFTYDRLNRLQTITPPTNASTTITWNTASVTTKTATRGSGIGALTEVTTYDGFGRVKSVSLDGIVTTYALDALGRIGFVSHPGVTNVGTSYGYDILNRVRTITNGDQSIEAIDYGAATRSVKDERQYSTLYTYRAYGDPDRALLIAVSNPSAPAANISIGRDDWDQVHTISQGGFTRTYDYDTRRYLHTVTNPETGTTTYGRDDSGNMTSKTVGPSGTTAHTYDGQNRLWITTYPDATPSVTRAYWKTGKLKNVVSSVATRAYTYDANGNLVTETLTVDGVSGTLTYGYSALDQLSSLTYPYTQRLVSYSPNRLGRPTLVSGFVNSVSYWNSGQIYQINYANNTTTTYDQQPNRLWPKSFTTSSASGSTYVNNSFVYDAVGNLKTVTDSVDASFNRTLDYDALNRLTTASGPWGTGTISYDGTGNITTQNLGAMSLGYSYNPTTNRLDSLSGARAATYGYDAYGNITSTGSASYSYDSAPNMTCALCSSPTAAVGYRYDGMNRRVSVLKGNLYTYEFYDFNGKMISELTPGLVNRTVDYIYLGDKRIAQVEPTPTTINAPPYPGWSLTSGRAGMLSVAINGTSPTGTVSFYDGSTLLGTALLVSGTATLTTTISQAGLHNITVAYIGDANNAPSTTTVTLQVLVAPEQLIPILSIILDDN